MRTICIGGVALLLIVLGSAGCHTSTAMVRLPAYERASTMEGPSEPRVFESTPTASDVPASQPFAVVSVGRTYSSRAGAIGAVKSKVKGLKPDFVVILGESELKSAIGLTYVRGLSAICYRIQPARIGFQLDRDSRVVQIDERSNLRSSGITEGDRLLSINGAAIASGAYQAETLRIQPGDDVELTWLTASGDRKAGRARAIANDGLPVP